MQKMFNAGCEAKEYQEQKKDYNFPNMEGELCPHCRRDLLKKHGYYQRYLILLDFEGWIHIRRYICKECGKTVSLLPSFAHPKRVYGTRFIIGILEEFYIRGKSVVKSVSDFAKRVVVSCSRQLLRHYRKRIKENLNMLVMGIINVFRLHSPPVKEKSDKKMRVRQFLEYVSSSPEEISLKIFEYSQKTYLTSQPY